MAQGDLYKLIQEIDKELKSNFRETVDTYSHVLDISAKQIAAEISMQIAEYQQPGREKKGNVLTTKLGRTSGASREEATMALAQAGDAATVKMQNDIRAMSEQYARDVLNEMKTTSNYEVKKLGGSDTEYKLQITWVGESPEELVRFGKKISSSSVFNFIADRLKGPRDMVRNKIKNNLKVKITNEEVVFNLGHINAVSTFKINRASSRLAQVQTNSEYAKIATGLLNYNLISQFVHKGDPEIEKSFEGHVVYVRPESQISNNLQSVYETALINELKKALEGVIKGNKSWAEQKGSSSAAEAIAALLLDSAKKYGAEVSRVAKDFASNTAKLSRKLVQRQNFFNDTATLGQVEVSPGPSAVSLGDLIPSLNQSLPAQVRSNMGVLGRLHNRTGRFSESAQILNVDGGGFLTYTYMKSPYQVFEKDGAKDPRNVIELSIRQLAQGIIAEKFNLRRL
jgi:hypothetical protein